jgi:hypothetical protein
MSPKNASKKPHEPNCTPEALASRSKETFIEIRSNGAIAKDQFTLLSSRILNYSHANSQIVSTVSETELLNLSSSFSYLSKVSFLSGAICNTLKF